MNDTSRRFAAMSGRGGVAVRRAVRGGIGLLAALGAAALLGEVTTRRTEEGWSLAVELSGWIVLGALAVAAGGWWLRRRRRPAPLAPPDLVVGPAVDDGAAGTVTVEPLPAPAAAGAPYLERLLVRSPRAITVVEVEEVARIEAEGRYVRLHAAGRTHLAQYTLAELEARLDPRRFVRVHRSEIVNLRRVRGLRTEDHRDFEVLLDDGTPVRLSRTYRPRLEAALGLPL